MNQLYTGFNGVVKNSEFELITRHLTDENDPYLALADFESYKAAQGKIDTLYRDKKKWNKMSAANIAGSGIFSSDNTIRKYAKEIWDVTYD